MRVRMPVSTVAEDVEVAPPGAVLDFEAARSVSVEAIAVLMPRMQRGEVTVEKPPERLRQRLDNAGLPC